MNKIVVLNREISDGAGTFGKLILSSPTESSIWWYSAEDDWLNNTSNISCIPKGDYILKRTIYQKYGYETFEVTGVPNRNRILIHPGNTEEDSQGCILVGMSLGFITVTKDEDSGLINIRKRAVLESKKAFQQFMTAMQGLDNVPFKVIGVVG